MKTYRPNLPAGDTFNRPHKFQSRSGRENQRRRQTFAQWIDADDEANKIAFLLVVIATILPIIGSLVFRAMDN